MVKKLNYQNRSGCRIPRGVPRGLPNSPPPGANFFPNLPVQPGVGGYGKELNDPLVYLGFYVMVMFGRLAGAP